MYRSFAITAVAALALLAAGCTGNQLKPVAGHLRLHAYRPGKVHRAHLEARSEDGG